MSLKTRSLPVNFSLISYSEGLNARLKLLDDSTELDCRPIWLRHSFPLVQVNSYIILGKL